MTDNFVVIVLSIAFGGPMVLLWLWLMALMIIYAIKSCIDMWKD